MGTDEPASSAQPGRNASPSPNPATTLYLLCIFACLLGVLCLFISMLTSEFALRSALTGIGIVAMAFGAACFGVCGIALYQHPEWELPVRQHQDRYEYTRHEHTFIIAWLGLVTAIGLAGLAPLVFTRVYYTMPPALFGAGAAAVGAVAIAPMLIVLVRARARTRRARGTN